VATGACGTGSVDAVMQPRVAVIVCAHLLGRLALLDEALDSLRRQRLPPDEIVVVIDGDPDLAAVFERRERDHGLVVLPTRSGLAAARNAGVAACSADYVFFLDDDAVADPDWISILAAVMAEDRILGASGFSAPRWGARRPAWLPDEFLWTIGCSYAGQPTQHTRVRNVYGGCCCLSRALFTELGGYDARFGRSARSRGGGEEADLCLRARERWPGVQLAYEPAARIDHYVPPERLRLRYAVRRSYDEGRMKARVSAARRDALVPELRFAGSLPAALARSLLGPLRGDLGGPSRAAGIALLAGAVVAGIVVGWTERLRTGPAGRA